MAVEKLGKADLAEQLSDAMKAQYGRPMTKTACVDVVTAVYDLLAAALAAGSAVTIPRVGTLKQVTTNPRTCKVPGQPGRTVEVPAKKTYRFKASSNIDA